MVRHRCDNPPCINPAHLLPGDHAANMADRDERDRCPRGENHAFAVLSDSDVAEIRAAYTGQRGEQARLSREYGVSHSHIHRIVNGLARKL